MAISNRKLPFVGDGPEAQANALIAGLMFIFSLIVYSICVTPTVPFWDSGEFISVSHILGIPHPPGTPLYVLIGRVFSLLPFGSVAQRINWLSCFGSAWTVLFTYLITVRLIKRNFLSEPGQPVWLAWVGGVVAAMFTAWGPTFWENAIEAEVYSWSSAIMCLCVWLALKWWDEVGRPNHDRFIWAILYFLFLSIGIHLGTFLVFPCIYLLITMTYWGRVKKGWFWGSTIVFGVAMLLRFMVVAGINDQDPRVVELSMAPPDVQQMVGFLSLVTLVAVVINFISVLGMRFAAGVAILAVIGVSVHTYLYIRAHLNPNINEGDPANWESLKLFLLRDQYKPPEPIFRKADLWGYQFPHMYLRYFQQQFHLFKAGAFPTWIFPVGLGIFGAFMNATKEKKTFWLMFTLFLITGPFMVWYLNFREGEVRERDYFFTQNFHFFAIWIGMGVVAMLQAVQDLLGAGAEKAAGTAGGGAPAPAPRLAPAVVGLAALMVGMSVLPLVAGEDNKNFHVHDRRGNYVAHSFAYNMLVGLEKDAILFTNGDNDTFPLWYLQEVENFRKDVRVICLSLLNTEWCIRQIRDFPPKVPVTLNDTEIKLMEPEMVNGRVMMVKDKMVQHIIKANNWQRPIYLAVTVPDQMGLNRQLSMEGLVFRVNKDPVRTTIDVAKSDNNLNRLYKYEGFLTPAGDWDTKVYKDDETSALLQNYAAAWVQLAIQYHDAGQPQKAMEQMARAGKFAPEFPGVALAMGAVYERFGDLVAAERMYADVIRRTPYDPRALSAMGHLKTQMGDTTAAIDLMNRAIQLDPESDFNPYAELINIYFEKGDYQKAAGYLEAWLKFHPDDQRVRNTLDMLRGNPPPGAPTPGAGSAPPPPPGNVAEPQTPVEPPAGGAPPQ